MLHLIANAQDRYMLVGTYDSPKSEGIYVYRFDSKTGNTVPVSVYKNSNPSFITISPDEKYVYAVSEVAAKDGSGGAVIALAFNKQNGMLTLINRQSSGGDHPCHVETDRTGRWLFVSNYSSGTLSVLPISVDGSLGNPSVIKHFGTGKDPVRQKSPHVHGAFISPDNKQLLVTDLGTDKVMLYDFEVSNGSLTPSSQPSVASVSGSGPRSLCFDEKGRMVYVIEELSGTIAVYKYKHHKLDFKLRIFTNEKGDSSFPGSAHIQLSADGRFLYTSSRAEHNTINVYIMTDEFPHFQQRQSSLGRAPRHFSLDASGNWLLCGNQNSDEIVIFKRDIYNGLLADSKKRIQIGKPVCIKWININ